jgi:hypothetical protein
MNFYYYYFRNFGAWLAKEQQELLVIGKYLIEE